MSAQTPRCGSTTDARKRLAEKASTPIDRNARKAAETMRVTVTVDTDELRAWAEKHADAGHHGVAHVLYQAADDGESLSEQHDAQVRRETAEKIAQAVWTHADHMAGYTLPALSSGFIEGYTHALNLLRRDAGFIARQSVEGGGERG